jgi:TonB family protein
MRIPYVIMTVVLVAAAPAAAQDMGASGGGGGGTGGGGYSQAAKAPSLRSTPVKYYPQAQLAANGKAAVKFIVDPSGHVEPASIEVTSASDSTFAEAARMTLLAQEYYPGSDRGQNVRAASNYEFHFKPGKTACGTVVTSRGVALCVDSLGGKK